MKEIFVGNLPESATDADLQALFSQYGDVTSARVVREERTPVSKSVAYVEMPEKFAALAIECLNGHEFRTRELIVHSAETSRWQSDKQPNLARGSAGTSFVRQA